MVRILKGDVMWANLDPTQGHEQSGRRPVLILSHPVFNEKSGTVIAVALTSQPQKAPYPLTLQLSDKIVNKTAWVKISQIRTLSTTRLGAMLGRVTEDEVRRVIEGLNELLA